MATTLQMWAKELLYTTNYNLYFTCYCNVFANNKYAFKCQIYVKHAIMFICTYQTTTYAYIPHKNSLQSTMWKGTLVYSYNPYYWNMPQNKYTPAALLIHVTLHCYFSLHIDPRSMTIWLKNKANGNFYHHVIVIYLPTANMALKFQICHILAHVHIWDNYPYELTANNSVPWEHWYA